MWSKIGRYALYVLAWGLIVGYIIYSSSLARTHRKTQKIDRVEIIITDSAMHGNLITTSMVRGWISSSGVEIVGRAVEELPVGELEDKILTNGFVERVKIYPTYSGALRVELTQRRPTFRLLVNGYNEYSTKEGYIFESPHFASLYVPVVTGSYSPPFPPSFRGSIDDFLREQSARIDEQIAQVEREKYPLFEREEDNLNDTRELRRMFIDQGWFESDEAFDKRVVELRAEKARLRKLYKYRGLVLSSQIAKITDRQETLREDQKKLKKRCEDFAKLINFVEVVENDSFWRAEVVQIVASQSQSGALRVNFLVRSGDFVVEFGGVESEEEIKQKLSKLFEFYKSGLRRVGWQKYRSINVEYKNQIVCK